jgi:hypothetical protein
VGLVAVAEVVLPLFFSLESRIMPSFHPVLPFLFVIKSFCNYFLITNCPVLSRESFILRSSRSYHHGATTDYGEVYR